MARSSFDALSTTEFNARMRPVALRLYERLFAGCRLEQVDTSTAQGMVLDRDLGVDCKLHLPTSQWITLQEKFRKYADYVSYGDFTQEFKNGVGTPYESDGEWFKLGAQLYFYGWASQDETAFVDWVILNIATYKLTINRQGGLDKVGRLVPNHKHGRATFYAIPLERISKAIILSASTPLPANRSALPIIAEHLNGKPDTYAQATLFSSREAFR